MKNAIQKAIEGGYNVGPIEVDMICDNKYDHYLLDPLFWQSLEKSCGPFKDGMGYCTLESPAGYAIHKEVNWPTYSMIRFAHHIAEGGTPDEFFAALLK